MDSEWETVKVEKSDGGITWLIMNRPEKRNCMSPTLHREMVAALTQLQVDDDTKVLVLTGAGAAWCAGMDIKEFFRDLDDRPKERMVVRQAAAKWLDLLINFPTVTIAMVNGWCVGGAFDQLHACDLAIAADEAKFCISEVNWGIIPGGTVTKVVADAVSWRDAMYYILTADEFDGRQAAAMHMVNYSVPLERLREETIRLARKVMSKNPATLRAAKEAARAVRTMDYTQAAEYLNAKQAQMRFVDAEHGRQTGMAEFLDKKSYRPALAPFPRDSSS